MVVAAPASAVQEEPVAAIDFSVRDGQFGVHFTPVWPADYPPTSWTWLFGDGHMSALEAPTHHYDEPGPYRVTLEAELEGAGNVTRSMTVRVGEDSKLVPEGVVTVTLEEEGLVLWLDGKKSVWPEIALFVGGALLVTHAYIQGKEAEINRKRGIADRRRGWRQLQAIIGVAMVLIVLHIELSIKGVGV